MAGFGFAAIDTEFLEKADLLAAIWKVARAEDAPHPPKAGPSADASEIRNFNIKRM